MTYVIWSLGCTTLIQCYLLLCMEKRKCVCVWRPLWFSDLKINVFPVWISFTLEYISGVYFLCACFGRRWAIIYSFFHFTVFIVFFFVGGLTCLKCYKWLSSVFWELITCGQILSSAFFLKMNILGLLHKIKISLT